MAVQIAKTPMARRQDLFLRAVVWFPGRTIETWHWLINQVRRLENAAPRRHFKKNDRIVKQPEQDTQRRLKMGGHIVWNDALMGSL